MCQYLHFCTSKASKVSMCVAAQCLAAHLNAAIAAQQAVWSVCQYLYFCTSKTSKVSMCVAAQCLAAHLNAEIAAGNIAKVLVFGSLSSLDYLILRAP